MVKTVSVIIPTKDRPLDLELTVESMLQQSILPTQLIVVDQSHGVETQKRLGKLFAEAPFPARIQLYYVRDSTISGLTVARNCAMQIAPGDIWLFLDDDVCLEACFIEEILAVYHRYPQVSGVSGIISNYQRPSWAYRLWASIFVRGPFHDERQPIYWRADRLRQAEPIRVGKLTGALMSFRANAIRGRHFDENLRGVCDGEDVDFCARLGPSAVLVIAPRARLVHKTSPSGRSQDHWLKRLAQANFYLYDRNWKKGIGNRLSFLWFNAGLALVAALASLRAGSLVPWRALTEGAREGQKVGTTTSQPARQFPGVWGREATHEA